MRELASSTAKVDGPFKPWSQAPTPLANSANAQMLQDIVSKTQPVEVKNPTSPSGWESGRVDIPIHGHSELAGGLGHSVTWANRLGGSAFAIQSDDRLTGDQAPSALAHAYAGIAFCFMTQLLRYVEHHHMKVRALRMVQHSALNGTACGYGCRGCAGALSATRNRPVAGQKRHLIDDCR